MEAVRFEDVSKRFIIQHQKARTFQEAALNLARLRRPPNGEHEVFWALRNVSFSLERGRTLGIIGRNGSGKSTLLKLLARTMRPTSGEITAQGRVFGLLELAAGFHPELSGRENVFLNGTFLGLSRREMIDRLDQIVAFSELEQFIDTPVKHYSSGMYMRLGFAIALSVEPDIMVIDEVLAVGDAAFRQKCFVALADFKARQKTILFVTHDAAAVRRFCDEAIWLDHGAVRDAGRAEDVLREYLSATQSTRGSALAAVERPADPLSISRGPITLLAAETVDRGGVPERHFLPGQPMGVRIRYRAEKDIEGVSLGTAIHRADGQYVAGASTAAAGIVGRAEAGEGTAVCWVDALPLAAAEYTVSAAVWAAGEPTPLHRLSQVTRFAVRPPLKDQSGMLALALRWEAAEGLTLSGGEAAGPAARPATDRGSASDASLPVDGFFARWRRPPSRLVMGQGEDEFLGPGWYQPEDWPPRVRWTTERAVAYLTQDEWTASIGLTMCRPQHDGRTASGRVYVGGRLAGRFEAAAPALEPFTFPVEPVDSAREVEVVLEIDGVLQPTGGETTDRRVLGVAVHELWME